MKRILNILFLILLPLLGLSQHARINITSGYMKIGASGNGAYSASNLTQTYLVIDNLNTTALTASAGSGIITEGEFNMIQWNIGATTGTFTIPFISADLVAIPLTATISVAGTNAGTGNASIEFSTWDTQPDNSNGTQSIDGLPNDVTNMDAAYAGRGSPSATDDSYNVVDRFWVIDNQSSLLPNGVSAQNKYTAGHAPTIALQFYYLGSTDAQTEVSSPNIFVDGQLMAQRFNSTLGTWSDYTPGLVSDNAGGSTSNLTTLAVASANWGRSWTLSNINSPMPIKLLSFTADCQNYQALLKWSTATESNNSYFTIDRSSDGLTYQTIAVVKGAGNSSTTLDYSTVDDSPMLGTSYYRLSQTDFDGNNEVVGTVVYIPCEGSPNTINAYWATNYINVQINSAESSSSNYTINLCNALGQIVYSDVKTIIPGDNEFKLNTDVTEGVYFLTVNNNNTIYHKKILIKR